MNLEGVSNPTTNVDGSDHTQYERKDISNIDNTADRADQELKIYKDIQVKKIQ